MSEIKGTLLGIVLTIAIFGAIFGVMKLTFQGTAETISERAAEVVETALPSE